MFASYVGAHLQLRGESSNPFTIMSPVMALALAAPSTQYELQGQGVCAIIKRRN